MLRSKRRYSSRVAAFWRRTWLRKPFGCSVRAIRRRKYDRIEKVLAAYLHEDGALIVTGKNVALRRFAGDALAERVALAFKWQADWPAERMHPSVPLVVRATLWGRVRESMCRVHRPRP